MNLDSLLDATLDDIDDLPEIKPFPEGATSCSLSLSAKEVAGKPAIEAEFTCKESLGLTDPQDEPPKVGDKASTLFFLDNEFGKGKFKVFAQNFVEMVGSDSLRAIVDGVKDVDVILVSTIKVDKKDSTKQYLNVVEMKIV